MKGSSKVIMGATLVMVVTLAIVLGLVLVLLIELYCSLLLRRRRHLRTNSSSSSTDTTHPTTTISSSTDAAEPTAVKPSSSNSPPPQPQNPPPSTSPLSSIYSQGVLHAPRSFLFPSNPLKENKKEGKEKKSQSFQLLHHVVDIHNQESNSNPRSPHRIGIISSPLSTPFVTSPDPLFLQENRPQVPTNGDVNAGGVNSFVYISNPIYDNEGNRGLSMNSREDTPFETPDTSPSRLETGDSSASSSSGEEEIKQVVALSTNPNSPTSTPPLTPMKKLPENACSVSLKDAKSLPAASASDSISINGVFSSSSGSPCTSPSW